MNQQQVMSSTISYGCILTKSALERHMQFVFLCKKLNSVIFRFMVLYSTAYFGLYQLYCMYGDISRQFLCYNAESLGLLQVQCVQRRLGQHLLIYLSLQYQQSLCVVYYAKDDASYVTNSTIHDCQTRSLDRIHSVFHMNNNYRVGLL